MAHEALLAAIGTRVRARRESQGLSRRQLSEKSGISERFLAQLEAGTGNISLRRFADLAIALGMSPADLLAGTTPRSRGSGIIALLGVRGAGKSTVGALLAVRYSIPFIEVDHAIERSAGLSLGEIFEMHGEGYYRRLEKEELSRLLGEPRSIVLATGGSIVNDRENYSMLLAGACTVWLKAAPEDHWNRVLEQGDARPMAKNPHAFAELRALLAAREPLYANAHHIIDTRGCSVEEVVSAVSEAIAGEFGGEESQDVGQSATIAPSMGESREQ
ncbi:MAG: helix-turn-helix domain-containing protein [Proteobacteria bacterium]|nr:helix-turn-helix domain-containing protein [Pseudomonadota bacterium]